MEEKMNYLVATCIIVKDGKYLIAKRAPFEKAFPNLWTVPGGKLESKDLMQKPKDAGELWYNVVEDLVRREVKEEANLEVGTLDYVTSLAYIRPDGKPCVIISMFAEWKKGEVQLPPALTEYAWVTLEESKNYALIDGIQGELEVLDRFLKTGKKAEWKRSN